MDNQLLIARHPLFDKICREDTTHLVQCLQAHQKQYKKGEYAVFDDMPVQYVCAVLSGRIFMETIDQFGNKCLYTEIRSRSLLGEPNLYPDSQGCNVNYTAITDCSLLLMEYGRLLHPCSRACPCHRQLIENFIGLLIQKNQLLMQKIDIVSKKSLRDRIQTYLLFLMRQQRSATVTCPLNRTELAEFLCVNRSAMTREIYRMQKEGLIELQKQTIRLKDRHLWE